VRTVRRGDVIDDARVVRIARTYVELERSEGVELMRVGPSRALHPALARTEGRSAIRQVGSGAWSVRRDELAGMASPAWNDVRIVPGFENGLPVGLRLTYVRPGSIYAQFELRSGDAITRINGRALDVESALSAYEALRGARRFDVDLRRDGTLLRHTYLIE
jgi:type II secretory pathway component PulC